MLFRKDDKPVKNISIDAESFDNSIFSYSVSAGLLWASNKRGLLLDGKPNSWSPESLQQLHLNDFPLVEDFRIEFNSIFRPEEQVGPREYVSVDFLSREHGILIRTMFLETYVISNASIPTGTLEKPHIDADEGYFLVIFQHEKFVYFLCTSDIDRNLYEIWFKVPVETYAVAWLHIKQWYEVRRKGEIRFGP